MRFFDYIKLALKNLWRNKFRTFLTIIAVVIGAMSVLTLVTLVFTAQKVFYQQLEQIGALTIISVTGSPDAEGDLFGAQSIDPGKKLDDTVVNQLKKIDHVTGVSPNIRIWQFKSVRLKGADKKYDPRLAAYEAIPVFDHEIIAGRNLQKNDLAKVVVGGNLVKKFGYSDQAKELVGRKVIFTTHSGYSGWGVDVPKPPRNADRTYWDALNEKTHEIEAEIVGVIAPGFDDQNYVSLTWAEEIMLQKRYEQADETRPKFDQIQPEPQWRLVKESEINRRGYDMIMVKVESTDQVEPVAEKIRQLDLGAQTAKDFLVEIQKVTKIVGLIFGSIGAISLGVATIGIINTMAMAIYERTREIGVMRAVGATRATIRRLFTFEAALIGFLGGVIGIGLMYLLVGVANIFGNRFLAAEQIDMQNIISPPMWLVVGVIGFTTFLGLLAGLGPAYKAARLNPVEALRYE